MTEKAIMVKEVLTDLEEAVEAMFDKFIGEYEMDASGSIEDMLYEFYSEGFIIALEVLEGEE